MISTSCNEQVLHVCMIRTYHTNMLHMRTVVRKRNTLTLPCVTYAYSGNSLLRMCTTVRVCNTFVTHSYVWHMYTNKPHYSKVRGERLPSETKNTLKNKKRSLSWQQRDHSLAGLPTLERNTIFQDTGIRSIIARKIKTALWCSTGRFFSAATRHLTPTAVKSNHKAHKRTQSDFIETFHMTAMWFRAEYVPPPPRTVPAKAGLEIPGWVRWAQGK